MQSSSNISNCPTSLVPSITMESTVQTSSLFHTYVTEQVKEAWVRTRNVTLNLYCRIAPSLTSQNLINAAKNSTERKVFPWLNPTGWQEKVKNEQLRRSICQQRSKDLAPKIVFQKTLVRGLLKPSQIEKAQEVVTQLIKFENDFADITSKIASQKDMIANFGKTHQPKEAEKAQKELEELERGCKNLEQQVTQQKDLVAPYIKENQQKRAFEAIARLAELERGFAENAQLLKTTKEVLDYLDKVAVIMKAAQWNTAFSTIANACCPGAGLPISLSIQTLSMAAQKALAESLVSKLDPNDAAAKKERSNTHVRILLIAIGTLTMVGKAYFSGYLASQSE